MQPYAPDIIIYVFVYVFFYMQKHVFLMQSLWQQTSLFKMYFFNIISHNCIIYTTNYNKQGEFFFKTF